jgi:hypothetical protein
MLNSVMIAVLPVSVPVVNTQVFVKPDPDCLENVVLSQGKYHPQLQKGTSQLERVHRQTLDHL